MKPKEQRRELSAKNIRRLAGTSGDLTLSNGAIVKGAEITEVKKTTVLKGHTLKGDSFIFEVDELANFQEYGTSWTVKKKEELLENQSNDSEQQ